MHRFRGLRLITLDMTGTMFCFRQPPHIEYCQAAYGLCNIQCDPEKMRTSFSKVWKEINKVEPNFGSGVATGKINGSKQWWLDVVARSFKDCLGDAYSEEQVTSISHYLYDLYNSPLPYSVFHDARKFVQDLQPMRAKGQVQVGVVTNFDVRIHSILNELKLRQCFDFVTCSEEARVKKPDPLIFKRALENVDDLAPSNVLHVGDDVKMDYLGAKAVGWQAGKHSIFSYLKPSPIRIHFILNVALINRSDLLVEDENIDLGDICANFDELSQKIEWNQ